MRGTFFSRLHWYILQILMVRLALIGALNALRAELVGLF